MRNNSIHRLLRPDACEALIIALGPNGHVDRLSERFEAELARKPVRRSDKMTPDLLDRLMRTIDMVELEKAEVDSIFKINQNREPDECVGVVVAAFAEGDTPGQVTCDLVELMRALNPRE